MAEFLITSPDGKKYKVTGDSAQGAAAALKKMLGGGQQTQASVPPVADQPQALPSVTAQPQTQNIAPAPSAAIANELHQQGPVGVRHLDRAPAQTVTAGDGSDQIFNPDTGQYTNRELLAGHTNPTATGSFGVGGLQGISLGMADEVVGAIGGPLAREKMRADLDVARRDHSKVTLAGEVVGSLAIPLGNAARAATLGQAIKSGAKMGAVLGGFYSAASAEGGVINRVEAGLKGAVAGTLIGATVPAAIGVGSKAFRHVFKQSVTKPNIENLQAAKRMAYKAVDDAGEVFSPKEMAALSAKVKAEVGGSNYVSGVDIQTDAVLSLLDRKSADGMTLGQLDKLRQNFYKRLAKANNETGIIDAIDAIDEMISGRTNSSTLMDAARLANARYKKAELLDNAFQKARDQTAATGSGGNILNKYRQAVTSIKNNPKSAKWFTAAEIETMQSFIDGSKAENALRLYGKLSPNGNGLMMALNLGAVFANPGMLSITATATAAKALADRGVERGAQNLISKVGGGGRVIPKPPLTFGSGLNALAGPLANELKP